MLRPKFWDSRNWISYLLFPVSQIFRLIAKIRALIATPVIFDAKVICIGNIDVGGTGKTQVVSWIANHFKEQGINFVIITKGYGSKLKRAKLVQTYDKAIDVGDESIILQSAGKVIAAKKIQYATEIVKTINPDVIIVDDGMQNPWFHKDCKILVLDHKRMNGNGFLLPAGPLRQYPSEIQPDAVICVGGICKTEYNNVFTAKILSQIELDKKQKYLAFCGIGNPERFFELLEHHGAQLIEKRIFPDHHSYSNNDIKKLKTIAQDLKAKLITTRKDYVKLSDKDIHDIISLDIKLEIDQPNKLLNLIYEKVL